MQAGSSKIFHGLYALANRSLRGDFHTSACALKGGPRPKSRPSRGKSTPNPTRSPARKRLVTSLKPEGKAGTYEVAPRERARSRDNGPPQGGMRTSSVSDRRPPSSREGRGPVRDSMSQRYKDGAFESRRTSVPRPEKGQSFESRRTSVPRPEKGQSFESRRTSAPPPEKGQTFERNRSSAPLREKGSAFERNQTSDTHREKDLTFERRQTPAPRREKGPTFERRQTSAPRREVKKFDREDAPHKDRLPYEEYSRMHTPRRRGVDFGLRGSAARRPRFRPDSDGRGLISREMDHYPTRPEPPRITKEPASPRFRPDSDDRASILRGMDHYPTGPGPPRISKASASPPLPHEFETPEIEPLKSLPSRFTSPPLMEGLLQSVHDVLGPDARPSPVQSLALKHLFTPPPHIQTAESEGHDSSYSPVIWKQHLLAAETGSGKSMAYLLPMLQHLKLTENNPTPLQHTGPPMHPLPLNPRGLILAPTHELARQLSTFAKALLHHMRLRVLCVSRANTASSSRGRSTASQLKRELEATGFGMSGVGSVGLHASRPADVVVGTTTKVLEMVRGLGWNRAAQIKEDWDDARKERARRWFAGPQEMGLARIEWVVVDEADVLFDRDFELSTRLLLAEIAHARGYSHASFAALNSLSAKSGTSVPPPSTPLTYPFHLTLTSATIPASLASYLSIAHPKLARLASPRLHRLPSTLSTEHHEWTSGNKNADIEKRLLRVWADDAQGPDKTRSKVLVFCNKSTKVDDLGLYLKEKGIPNVALTSEGAARARGSNRHLAGFLKGAEDAPRTSSSPSQTTRASPPTSPFPSSSDSRMPHAKSRAEASPPEPHVLITTSLLSRGLDFSPQIQHVFLVDSPRNMIDFLHRAGRVGRAGNAGRVVLFGKSKGRGAEGFRDVRRRVGAVTN